MTRRKVDKSLINNAFIMREQGAPIAEILAATGLSQGTYYAYLHACDDAVEEAYRHQPIAPMLVWPGSKRGELDELLPYVPSFTGTTARQNSLHRV